MLVQCTRPISSYGSILDAQVRVVCPHSLFSGSSSPAEDFATAPQDEFTGIVNELVRSVGGRPIRSLDDAQWDEVGERSFRRLMMNLIRFGQAYNDERVSVLKAEVALNSFQSLFTRPRFFVNSDKHEIVDGQGVMPKGASGWGGGDGISGATFDTGCVLVGPARIGLWWFFDED